jgi:hypothetical protein
MFYQMPQISDVNVNSNVLPDPENEYVCWFDIMGTQSIMSRSLEATTIFLSKLHGAFLQAHEENDPTDVQYYPMGDGIFLTSSERDSLFPILSDTFAMLAKDVNEQDRELYRYVVKASVAYGPVIHGSEIPDGLNDRLDNTPEYLNSILLGIPVIQAFAGEEETPPFGVSIHESARAFAPNERDKFSYSWWEWFNPRVGRDYEDTAIRLRQNLEGYYDWCSANHSQMEYELSRIEEHETLMKQYFPN